MTRARQMTRGAVLRHAGYRMLNTIQALDVWPYQVRRVFLRAMGHDLHGTARIMSGVHFTLGRVRIGPGAFINHGCLLDAAGGIAIGSRVHLAPRVAVHTSTHAFGDASCRAGTLIVRPVTIEDGVWIGAGAQLLPGCRVGKGAMIGAGALVLKDVESSALYVGTPAKFVRRLAEGRA